ncbi:MAG: DUF1838 family protein [Cyanobacteria bacterium J06639_14]
MSQDYGEELVFSNLDFYRRNHGQQLYYSWSGEVSWTRQPGAEATKLFSIVGMNATKVFLKDHPEHGEVGYRINRELALYCDPESQEILYTWRSQSDAKPVSVIPIANRIVQGQVSPKLLKVPAGKAYETVETKIPLDYPHPLADNPRYRDYCPGPRFQATECFTSHIYRLDATHKLPAQWSRDCPWLPWMGLGYGHPARLNFETTIQRVDTFEDLNPDLVALVRARVPIYEFAPDHSDESNMTSILYFKQHFDEYLEGKSFPIPEKS